MPGFACGCVWLHLTAVRPMPQMEEYKEKQGKAREGVVKTPPSVDMKVSLQSCPLPPHAHAAGQKRRTLTSAPCGVPAQAASWRQETGHKHSL